jgi:hypothetical protein
VADGRKWVPIAKKWSRLRLLDTEPEFVGLCPFSDEQVAHQAVLHVCARSEEFRRRFDGYLILICPLDSAILVGRPASLRRSA